MPTAYIANGPSIAVDRFGDEAVLINFQAKRSYSRRGAAPTGRALDRQPDTINRTAKPLDALERRLRKIDDADLNTTARPLASAGQSTIVQVFHDLEELNVLDPVQEVASIDGWPNRPPPSGAGTDRSE